MGLLGTLGGVLGGVFGPVGSTIGSALGGAIDSDRQQDRAEDFSLSSAQANRDFQERMSNSAWQRGVSDMKAAGLNPMLAYSQGPAGVPGGSPAIFPGAVGAQYQMAEASQSSAGAAVQQAETASRVADSTVSKIKQEITNLESDNARIKAVTDNLMVEYQNLVKEGYNKIEVGNQLRATIEKLKAEIPVLNSTTFLNVAREQLTTLESRLKSLDIDAAEGVGNLGREAGQLKPLFEILRMVLSQR